MSFVAMASESGALVVTPTTSISGEERRFFKIPFSMPRQQQYYWSTFWQESERGALVELGSKDFVEFSGDDPTDVARWLREPETGD
jgi:hypothetical protein